MEPVFSSTVVMIPFDGRKVKHLAGIFHDFSLAGKTFCSMPTNAMSREKTETPFDPERDCQDCAGEDSINQQPGELP